MNNITPNNPTNTSFTPGNRNTVNSPKTKKPEVEVPKKLTEEEKLGGEIKALQAEIDGLQSLALFYKDTNSPILAGLHTQIGAKNDVLRGLLNKSDPLNAKLIENRDDQKIKEFKQPDKIKEFIDNIDVLKTVSGKKNAFAKNNVSENIKNLKFLIKLKSDNDFIAAHKISIEGYNDLPSAINEMVIKLRGQLQNIISEQLQKLDPQQRAKKQKELRELE